MEVFISWSGQQARAVAVALRSWLKAVVQAAEPWTSSVDIYAGDRWAREIGARLETCDFGIVCVTPGNQDAPWLNFEAGALAKRIGQSRVVPYLHGITISNLQAGPLTQFQAKEATAEGTWELVMAVNQSTPSPLDAGLLRQVFDSMWSQLEGQLAGIITPVDDQKLAIRSLDEKVDELVKLQRQIHETVNHTYSEVGLVLSNTSPQSPAHQNVLQHFLQVMPLQDRAFLKPARMSLDQQRGIVVFDYGDKNVFHHRQALRHVHEYERVMQRISGGAYGVEVLGPGQEETTEDEDPWDEV